jgi:hypothetical protein
MPLYQTARENPDTGLQFFQGVTMSKLIRCVLVLVAFTLPVGFAQHLYLGAELAPLLNTRATDYRDLNVGAQLGLTFGGVGLRLTGEGNLAAATLEAGSLDALLNIPVLGSTVYLGAGADVLDVDGLIALTTLQTGGVEDALQAGVLGAHAVAGAELRLGCFGLFGELQPVYRLGEGFALSDSYFLRTRAGLNIHF